MSLGYKETVEEYLYPTSADISTSRIEYIEQGSSDYHIRLGGTRLIVDAMIVKEDGTPAVDIDDVAPVDNVLHSLFNQVDVWFGDNTRVSSSSLNYGYKAYIETVLNHDMDVKKTQLTMQHFYQDNNLARPSPKSGGENEKNWGLVKRHELCTKPNTFQMCGRVHSDVFNMTNLLLPGVKVRVRFSRSNQSFVLMTSGSEKYKIVITNAKLKLQKVRLDESFSVAQERALSVRNALYTYVRSDVKVFHIPKGQDVKKQPNLLHGVIPKRVTVGIVNTDAYNGNYQKNPYDFQKGNLVKISATVDGLGGVTHEFTPDFDEKKYVNAYQALFQGRSKRTGKFGNGISMDDYSNGYTLYCFDFTPCIDSEEGDHMGQLKSGNVTLHMVFDPPTTHAMTAIALCEMDGMITITKDREILTNYSL